MSIIHYIGEWGWSIIQETKVSMYSGTSHENGVIGSQNLATGRKPTEKNKYKGDICKVTIGTPTIGRAHETTHTFLSLAA